MGFTGWVEWPTLGPNSIEMLDIDDKGSKKRNFDLDNTKRRGVQILRSESGPVGLCAVP